MEGQGLFGFSCFIAQSDIRKRYFMFFIYLFLFSSEGPVFIYQKEKESEGPVLMVIGDLKILSF